MDSRGKALVLRSTGSSYMLSDLADGTVFESGIRGKVRLKGVRTTNPVSVGDIVDYEMDDAGSAVISSIEPRRNYIIRRSSNLSKESHIIAANLDQAALVVTLAEPQTKPEFIDRFLVTCEAYGVPATLILNKIDLIDQYPEMHEGFRDIYGKAGYQVMEVSATAGMGLEGLRDYLSGKITLLAGNSGVGKSSLISSIIPDADVTTAEISDYHRKGRHTTTFARMYALPEGGYVIDSPGIKGFGLIDIESAELYHFFPEFMRHSSDCQYYNCTHIHEPGCAVIDAVADDRVAESRYISYLKILEEDEKYRK